MATTSLSSLEYQRPYAWGVEKPQLLSDLLGALEHDTDDPYFPVPSSWSKAPNNTRAEVIDGQQRLTTLTLLLSLLRDLATDDELRRDIHKSLRNQPSAGKTKLRDPAWNYVHATASSS